MRLMQLSTWSIAALTCVIFGWGAAAPASAQERRAAQITLLYDAFGKTSTMKKDWGFSAFIEYGGKRIYSMPAITARTFRIMSKPKAPASPELPLPMTSTVPGALPAGLNT